MQKLPGWENTPKLLGDGPFVNEFEIYSWLLLKLYNKQTTRQPMRAASRQSWRKTTRQAMASSQPWVVANGYAYNYKMGKCSWAASNSHFSKTSSQATSTIYIWILYESLILHMILQPDEKRTWTTLSSFNIIKNAESYSPNKKKKTCLVWLNGRLQAAMHKNDADKVESSTPFWFRSLLVSEDLNDFCHCTT
jgi:hypothetical protein